MTALHELTGQMLELSKMDDLPAEVLADTMTGMVGTFEDKAQSLAKWVMDIDGDAEKIDAEIKRLQAKKKALINRKESLYGYLQTNMEATGISKISCPLFNINLNAGRDSVSIHDEAEIPEEFMRVKTEVAPDKKAIADAINSGIEVPGASLGKGSSFITIK